MTTIKKIDFIDSVANALQFISYYHSEDFILAMSRALEIERSPEAVSYTHLTLPTNREV